MERRRPCRFERIGMASPEDSYRSSTPILDAIRSNSVLFRDPRAHMAFEAFQKGPTPKGLRHDHTADDLPPLRAAVRV